jgi:hypothetical protein
MVCVNIFRRGGAHGLYAALRMVGFLAKAEYASHIPSKLAPTIDDILEPFDSSMALQAKVSSHRSPW